MLYTLEKREISFFLLLHSICVFSITLAVYISSIAEPHKNLVSWSFACLLLLFIGMFIFKYLGKKLSIGYLISKLVISFLSSVYLYLVAWVFIDSIHWPFEILVFGFFLFIIETYAAYKLREVDEKRGFLGCIEQGRFRKGSFELFVEFEINDFSQNNKMARWFPFVKYEGLKPKEYPILRFLGLFLVGSAAVTQPYVSSMSGFGIILVLVLVFLFQFCISLFQGFYLADLVFSIKAKNLKELTKR